MRSSKARWTMALKAFDTNSEFRKEWDSPIRIERSEKIGKRREGGGGRVRNFLNNGNRTHGNTCAVNNQGILAKQLTVNIYIASATVPKISETFLCTRKRV